MPINVVLSIVYPDDNRGSAALTASAIETIRDAFPGCSLSLMTTSPSAKDVPGAYRHTLREFPDVEILPLPMGLGDRALSPTGIKAILRSLGLLYRRGEPDASPSVRRLMEADVVVGRGGPVFARRFKYRGLVSFYLTVALPLILARRCGAKTALFGVGVWPLRPISPLGMLAAFLLRHLDLVIVRDRLSFQQVLRLAPASRVTQAPDSVFLLRPSSIDRTESILEKLGLKNLRFATVTVTRPEDYTDPLHGFMESVLRQALDSGLIDRVVIVLQCDGARASDVPASEDFVTSMDDRRVTLLRADLDPSDLIALYRGASFMLGSRIHSTILSLIAGTPAFPVTAPYDRRAGPIFESIGLSHFHFVLGRDDPTQAAGLIRSVVEGGAQARSDVRACVEHARLDVIKTANRLRALLVSAEPPPNHRQRAVGPGIPVAGRNP